MWKNMVEPDRPQMTIWRMRMARWIPKATNTHSEYVILIAFPLQQWLHERASMLHCTYIVLFGSDRRQAATCVVLSSAAGYILRRDILVRRTSIFFVCVKWHEKKWRQQVPKNLPYVSTKVHGFIFPKTIALVLTALRISWLTDNQMAPLNTYPTALPVLPLTRIK
jgi:hypothetical protein